jgi:DNA repair exonuclease SbcCD ATPase subunit
MVDLQVAACDLRAERDEARTRLLKSEEDCKRLIAERDEARRERDSYMVQAHKIASDRDMLRDQTDDILDYQQQIADLTRERDEAREDWRVAQVNLQHASATRRHSAFAMSEWLRDAVEVGLASARMLRTRAAQLHRTARRPDR